MTQINVQKRDGNVRMAPIDIRFFVVTTAGTTQNITLDNVKTIREVRSVVIVNSANNTRRAPSGAITFSGNTVTVVDGTSMAVNDVVIVEVFGWNAE